MPALSPQTQFNPARFHLLRQASFGAGASALEAFRAWEAQIDWREHVNTSEFHLLPCLYRNLSAQGITHPRLATFKGIARKAWYHNNLYFHRLTPTIQALHEASVKTLLLYGGAFALRYDRQYVLEYGGDCAILVPNSLALCAFETLARLGWQPLPVIPPRALPDYLQARFFHAFQNAEGERLTLQWQLLPHCPRDDADAPFWERACETTMGSVPVLTLEPTDQLLHTCVFGQSPRGASSWRRVTEAQLLLCAASAEINWDAFLTRVSGSGLVLPVRQVFAALDASVSARVPSAVLAKIAALSVSAYERRAPYWWNPETPRARVARVWQLAARRACQQRSIARALAFPRFLAHWWGLENVTHLVPRAFTALRWQSGVSETNQYE